MYWNYSLGMFVWRPFGFELVIVAASILCAANVAINIKTISNFRYRVLLQIS